MRAAAKLDLDDTWELDNFAVPRLPSPSKAPLVMLASDGDIEGFHQPGDSSFVRFALDFTAPRRPLPDYGFTRNRTR